MLRTRVTALGTVGSFRRPTRCAKTHLPVRVSTDVSRRVSRFQCLPSLGNRTFGEMKEVTNGTETFTGRNSVSGSGMGHRT